MKRLARWLKGTSNRTFVLWPVVLLALEAAWQRGWPAIEPWGLPLLAWGYLQYKLVGRFRLREGRGGPGVSVPPERIVDWGPYRFIRNPMYLGHLVFFAGLAITLRSWVGLALLVFHVFWFDRRVAEDEARLAELFGDTYEAYRRRTARWIPGLR